MRRDNKNLTHSRSRSRDHNRRLSRQGQTSSSEIHQSASESQRQPSSKQRRAMGSSFKRPSEETHSIMENFMKFFDSIDHKTGFNFNPSEREKIIKQQNKVLKNHKGQQMQFINWLVKPTWNPEEETRKVELTLSAFHIEFKNEQKAQEFMKMLREASSLFNSESTQEVYDLICSIWKILCSEPEESGDSTMEEKVSQFIRKVASNSSNKFPFFSFQFSKYHKLKEPYEQNYEDLASQIYVSLKAFKTQL